MVNLFYFLSRSNGWEYRTLLSIKEVDPCEARYAVVFRLGETQHRLTISEPPRPFVSHHTALPPPPDSLPSPSGV